MFHRNDSGLLETVLSARARYGIKGLQSSGAWNSPLLDLSNHDLSSYDLSSYDLSSYDHSTM
jgi:hypothetical protein